jgi:hypothetical protein
MNCINITLFILGLLIILLMIVSVKKKMIPTYYNNMGGTLDKPFILPQFRTNCDESYSQVAIDMPRLIYSLSITEQYEQEFKIPMALSQYLTQLEDSEMDESIFKTLDYVCRTSYYNEWVLGMEEDLEEIIAEEKTHLIYDTIYQNYGGIGWASDFDEFKSIIIGSLFLTNLQDAFESQKIKKILVEYESVLDTKNKSSLIVSKINNYIDKVYNENLTQSLQSIRDIPFNNYKYVYVAIGPSKNYQIWIPPFIIKSCLESTYNIIFWYDDEIFQPGSGVKSRIKEAEYWVNELNLSNHEKITLNKYLTINYIGCPIAQSKISIVDNDYKEVPNDGAIKAMRSYFQKAQIIVFDGIHAAGHLFTPTSFRSKLQAEKITSEDPNVIYLATDGYYQNGKPHRTSVKILYNSFYSTLPESYRRSDFSMPDIWHSLS